MRILVIQRTRALGTPMDDTVLDITVPSCAPHSPDMFVPPGAVHHASMRDRYDPCQVYIFRIPEES